MNTVVISQRIDELSVRAEVRDSLDQRMIHFILACGFLPVQVPNGMGNHFSKDSKSSDLMAQWIEAINPTAIVLSGGNNIGEYPSRDTTEIQLINFSLEKKLPLLGICRGMQMIGTWAGATLHKVEGHVAKRHELKGAIRHNVNSYHDLSLSTCPIDFEIIAQSSDSEIEAIKHKFLPWEGWMWHPEREPNFSRFDIERTKCLFRS